MNGPGVSTTIAGLAGIDRRQRAQRLGQLQRVLLDRAHARCRSTAPWKTRLVTRRFSTTYDTPEGVRTLSSSTRNTPSGPRMRSMPAMGMRTPPGGRRPRSLGTKDLAPSTRSAGITPARQDALLAVDVVEERAQRGDPLGQPALDPGPVGGGDDARDQADREDLLGAPLVGVDREGDALVVQRQLGQRLARANASALSMSRLRSTPAAWARGRPGASNSSS